MGNAVLYFFMCLFLDPYCLLCVFYSVLESISTARINRKPCVWKWTNWHAAEGFYPWRVHKFGAQEWTGNVSFQLSFIIGCVCETPMLGFSWIINLLMPNVDYSGRTAPLTSKCCILYIYSTNTGTENFKHGIYSPFFPLQNAVCFINLTY